MKNENGVDTHYVGKNLDRLLRDYRGTPQSEIARAMLRLAGTIDQDVRSLIIRNEQPSLILRDGAFDAMKTARIELERYPAKSLAMLLTRYAKSLDFRVEMEEEFQNEYST